MNLKLAVLAAVLAAPVLAQAASPHPMLNDRECISGAQTGPAAVKGGGASRDMPGQGNAAAPKIGAAVRAFPGIPDCLTMAATKSTIAGNVQPVQSAKFKWMRTFQF